MADSFGVNRSTARGIVARYIRDGRIRERPCGGRNNTRVDDEMRDCLEEIINENCVLTLSQINGELRRLPAKPLIHDRTIARNLEGMLFCVKLVRLVPPDRNRHDILQRRQEYGNCFMKLDQQDQQIIIMPLYRCVVAYGSSRLLGPVVVVIKKTL